MIIKTIIIEIIKVLIITIMIIAIVVIIITITINKPEISNLQRIRYIKPIILEVAYLVTGLD